jgi:hypothetical protein
MQQKQEESLNEIRFKLNEMTKIKENLKITNEFRPNFSFQETSKSSLFGSMLLNRYSNMNLFQSQILTNQRQSFELIQLCEFTINDKFTMLYRGTRDGFGSNDFHSKCDGHANTLRILKVKYNVFGGFTSVH